MPRRHVDQEVADLAGGNRLEMLGNRSDVPAVGVGSRGLDDVPGPTDVLFETTPSPFGLDLGQGR